MLIAVLAARRDVAAVNAAPGDHIYGYCAGPTRG